uniref:Uncharacterized protein n=1 Tax=Strongyloides papillosus TaxID=174720 RepID=A0A0N5BYH8_STREA
MIGFLTENGELNYFQKRQANLKITTTRKSKTGKTAATTPSSIKPIVTTSTTKTPTTTAPVTITKKAYDLSKFMSKKISGINELRAKYYKSELKPCPKLRRILGWKSTTISICSNIPIFEQLIAKNSTDIGCAIKKTELFIALFYRIQPAFDIIDEDYEEDRERTRTL